MDFVFVYRKGTTEFKVLDEENVEHLKDNSYTHIATLKASVWIEHILNSHTDDFTAEILELKNEGL